MRLNVRYVVFILSVLIVLAAGVRRGWSADSNAVENQLIVKFIKGVSESDARAIITNHYMTVVAVLDSATRESGQCILLLRSHLTTQEMINEISGLPEVESFSPNYIRKKRKLPNDPGFSYLWNLKNTDTLGADIDAENAWETTTGASDVVIAVIDSGINSRHEDLKDSLWENPKESFNNIDDDGNGIVDDVYGVRVVGGIYSNNTSDSGGHGSSVAGIAAAKGDNDIGICGVSWNSKIMMIAASEFTDAEFILAVNYIIKQKQSGVNIPVVNLSAGGPGRNPIFRDKIQELADNGIILATSAGNDAEDNDNSPLREYPASNDLFNIISVGASDKNDNPSSFSHRGRYSVDLYAPGEDVLSTDIGGEYAENDGTSFAAPHVAGMAALLASSYPDEDIYTRINRILSGVDELSVLGGKCLTGGRLNAANSVRADLGLNPFIITSDSRVDKRPGESFTLTGREFGADVGAVFFASNDKQVSASINSWLDTRIEGVVPEGAGRFVKVVRGDGEESNALEFSGWSGKAATSRFHTMGAAVVHEGKIYVFGGGVVGGTSDCEVYDPETDSWTVFTTMPAPRSQAGYVYLDDEVYFFGGNNTATSTLHTDVIKYSFESETWSTLAGTVAYPIDPRAVVFKNKIYLIGGKSSAQQKTANIYEYNATTGAFTVAATMSDGLYMHTVFSTPDFVVIAGGIDSAGFVSGTGGYFDGSSFSPLASAYFAQADVVTDGANAYICDGFNGENGTLVPFFYTYNFENEEWIYGNNTITIPETGKGGSALVYVDGRGIYSINGVSGTSDSKRVDFLSVASKVRSPANQPDSTVTVTVTDSLTSYESAGELKTKYNLPAAGDRLTDVRQFSATVSKAGALVHMQYDFTAPVNATTPSDMTLYKLRDVNNSNIPYTYALSKENWADGVWWLEDSEGSYVYSTHSLTENEVYSVHFCLKDNGPYDLNNAAGAVQDPLVLFSGTSASGSSSAAGSSDSSGSSGCVFNPRADGGLDLVLCIAGLFCLIAGGWLRRVKRN